MRVFIVFALLGLLGGCASQMPGSVTMAERPASQQPTLTEARRKARIHVELGQAYLEAARYGVALDEAKAAVSFDEDYAPAYLLMGLVHMFLEENDVAERHFLHARRLAPGDPEVGNSYGWFLCATGREKAGLELLAAVVRNPYFQTPSRAYTNAGLCELRLKNDGAAQRQFQRAIEADAGNRQALYQLAAISYRRGAFEASRRYLADLNQQGEPSAESLWLAIRVEHRLGDRSAEATLVQQLRRRFPASSEYQDFLQGQYQ